jgi:hypothetical protein
MRHEQVQDYLSAYIEGSLDSAIAAAIENHVRECDTCAREETTVRAVFRALDDPALYIAPPPMFHADVMRRVRLQQSGAATDKRGFLERIGWVWAAAGSAVAVAVVAVTAVTVGPLNSGTRGGLAPAVRSMQPLAHLALDTGGAEPRAGEDLRIRVFPPAGNFWTREVSTSSGLSAKNGSENRATVTLTVQPSATGTVQEALVRFRNNRDGTTMGRMVFLPVATNGAADARESWNTRPEATLQSVLEDVARVYDVTLTAPGEVLNAPVTLRLDNADAVTTLQALCRATGLHYDFRHGTYHLEVKE